MGEWKERSLGELLRIKHGYAFAGEHIVTNDNGKVLVTPGNFAIGGGWKPSYKKFYKGDFPEEYILNEGDLVVTMTDLSKDVDTLGYSARVPRGERLTFLHNQRIGLVTEVSDEADPDFLYWVMRTAEYRAAIVNTASGSTVSHTSPSRIYEYAFDCPDLPEQRAIASVLSSLDAKIDLLHRQNKTLEAMAEALFRQWFVEEAEEGWEEGKLPDEFDFTMGQSPPGESFNEEGVGLPMYQGNADFGFRFPRRRVFTTDSRRTAEPFDTLISVRAPVGEQNMAQETCSIGRGVAAFRYRKNKSFYTYTYFKLRSMMEEIKRFNDEGTIFGSIGKNDFKDLDIVIPSASAIAEYEQQCKPMNDRVISNCTTIETLTALRDTLLPKLMSGEVRVEQEQQAYGA